MLKNFLTGETKEDEIVPHSASRIGTAYRSSSRLYGRFTLINRSGDGYRTRSSSDSGIERTTRTISNNNGFWTVTTENNDSSWKREFYSNGLLSSVKYYDSQNTELTETVYTYDQFDRLQTMRDGRGLITTYSYLENDAVSSMTDSANNVTTYTYDKMGRQIIVDAPDSVNEDGNTLSNITYTAYYQTGKMKGQWGGQTYPKFYRYHTSTGRMSELHTYRNGIDLGNNETNPVVV